MSTQKAELLPESLLQADRQKEGRDLKFLRLAYTGVRIYTGILFAGIIMLV
jgi:hypothetical protein